MTTRPALNLMESRSPIALLGALILLLCCRTAAVEEVGTVPVNGVSLEYVDWGGVGSAILLIPPGCDTAHVFGDIGPLLSEHHRTLSFTQRGCGKSEHPGAGYQIDDLAREIVGFLDTKGIGKATLAGASSGGGKITRVAELYPDRVQSLIYFDTIYSYIAPDLEELMGAAVAAEVGGAPNESFEHMRRSEELWELGSWSAAREKNLYEIYEARADGTLRGVSSSDWLAAFRRDVAAGLYTETKINHPALMFFAKDLDRYRAAQFGVDVQQRLQPIVEEMSERRRQEIEAFRSNGDHIKITELDRTAHYVFVQRPDEVARAIVAFLQH